MVLRIRQPALPSNPPIGTLTKTLGTATLASSATKVDGIAGVLNKTLGESTLSSTSSLEAPPRVVQEIWLYQEPPKSKRAAKRQKKAQAKIEAIEDKLQNASKLASQGLIQIEKLGELKDSLTQELDAIKAQFKVQVQEERRRKEQEVVKQEQVRQAAEERRKADELLRAQIAAVEAVKKRIKEQIDESARLAAENYKKQDDKVVAELSKLLNMIMETGSSIPEVSIREVGKKDKPSVSRRIGRFLTGQDGARKLTISDGNS
jgi:nucleoid-associated protein YgaU